tara:strand:+ start:1117 stop:1389 length:273 start_codon:yes stop_codon:yes gene_type:complete
MHMQQFEGGAAPHHEVRDAAVVATRADRGNRVPVAADVFQGERGRRNLVHHAPYALLVPRYAEQTQGRFQDCGFLHGNSSPKCPSAGHPT